MQSSNWAGRIRLTALGVLLCLLAAMFALEAKLAWYSPNSSTDVQISATKLRADDAPKQAAHAPILMTPVKAIGPEVALLLAFALVFSCNAVLAELVTAPPRFATSPGKYPPLFLRPPPCF